MTEYEKLLRDAHPGISDENVRNLIEMTRDFTMVDDETTGALGQLTIERCGDYAAALESNSRLRIEFLNADGLYLMSFESIEDTYEVEEVVPFHMEDGDEIWDEPAIAINQLDDSLNGLLIEDDIKKSKETNEEFNEMLSNILLKEKENVLGKLNISEEKLINDLEEGDRREVQHDLFVRRFPEMTGELSYWEFFDQTKGVSMASFENEPVVKIDFENGNGAYLLRHLDEDMVMPAYYVVPYVQGANGIEFPGDNFVLNAGDWAQTGINVGIEDALTRVANGEFSNDIELKNNVPQFAEILAGVDLQNDNAIRYNCDYYDLFQIVSESNDNVIAVSNGVIDKYEMTLEENNPMGMVVSFENGRVLSLQFEMDENSTIISKVEVVPFVTTEEGSFIRDYESSFNNLSINRIDKLEEIIQKTAERELVTAEEVEMLSDVKDVSVDVGIEL